MRTRKIRNRALLDLVFQELEPIAKRRRRGVHGTQNKVAALLREKRENIAYWRSPTTLGISAKAANGLHTRLTEIDRLEGRNDDPNRPLYRERPPSLAMMFDQCLDDGTRDLAIIAHSEKRKKDIQDLMPISGPIINAIANDGIEVEDDGGEEPHPWVEREPVIAREVQRLARKYRAQGDKANVAFDQAMADVDASVVLAENRQEEREVIRRRRQAVREAEKGNAPGSVFRSDLREVLEKRRVARGTRNADFHHPAIHYLFEDDEAHLALLRAALTLDPSPDAPLGRWSFLNSDDKRAWIRATIQQMRMSLRGRPDYAEHCVAANEIADRFREIPDAK